jgi:hypothetical protein
MRVSCLRSRRDTTINVKGAGTGAGQGTFTAFTDGLSPAGAIAGNYTDRSNVSHGFVRAANGKITTFNVKGAGTGSGQGSFSTGITPAGTIGGEYLDGSNVFHGFVRAACGKIKTFSVKGAGTGPGQGTFAGANNPAGAIAGFYLDGSNVFHGFLRKP